MPVSNSVIRRYTPPTCTLEVLAQSSALSRWMGKSVLKQLRFELRFDDPQLPEENRVAIRGNSDQLEALCAAVTSYVQEFLQMSPDNFWTNFSSSEDISTNSNSSEGQEDLNNQFLQTNNVSSFSSQIPKADIHIQPNSHLTHNLFLGSLANPASGKFIQLSLLQLFDLATALDEYSEDVMALPNLNSHSRVSTIPVWAPVAAVVVLAVGLTPITWQYADRIRQQEQTTQSSNSTQEDIALQDLPLTAAQPTPIPTFGTTGSGTFPPLGSTLPQLPNTSASSPSVSGFPAVPSTSQGSTQSNTASIPQAVPPNLNLPSTSQTSPNLSTFPTASLPSSGSTLTIPETQAPKISSPQKNAAAPLALPKESIALSPNPNQSSTASTSTSKIPNSSETSNPLSSNSPATSPANPPNLSTDPAPVANLPNPENFNANPAFSSSNSSTFSETDALIAKLREGRQSRRSAPTEIAATNSNTQAFDTPQLTEARDFLKQRWQPPSGLKQAIEYSLLVGVDGSIERIMPLGKAARDYVDRTGMPLIGEPFISPNRNGQSLRIRAVFSPDGKVQTFPEKN
ncbi:MAG: DUF4335 domain-containing protein [Scytonema sp. PMC 1070.18]|nr:DUF4335 domain-containing protein [Scytonema sp. PMC 1070.18]